MSRPDTKRPHIMVVVNGTEERSQSGHLPDSAPETHLDALVDRLMKPRTSAIRGLRKLSPNTYLSTNYYAITRIDWPWANNFYLCILCWYSSNMWLSSQIRPQWRCQAWSPIANSGFTQSNCKQYTVTFAREGTLFLGMAFCLGKLRQNVLFRACSTKMSIKNRYIIFRSNLKGPSNAIWRAQRVSYGGSTRRCEICQKKVHPCRVFVTLVNLRNSRCWRMHKAEKSKRIAKVAVQSKKKMVNLPVRVGRGALVRGFGVLNENRRTFQAHPKPYRMYRARQCIRTLDIGEPLENNAGKMQQKASSLETLP